MLSSFFLTLASSATAAYAGYATMAPGSQLYGRTVRNGADRTQIALTFDDGPNDPYTQRLLDLLEKHHAHATFFLIGEYVRRRPDLARAVHEAGHAIGNHTYSHPNLIFVPAARLRQELEDCGKAIEDSTGAAAPFFRPPFGGRRPNVLRTARAMGMEPLMWSVTSFDWRATSSVPIFEKVSPRISGARRGEIVLLHDGSHTTFGADRSSTVEATRMLLERYSKEGRRFVSVKDLRRFPGL